MSEPLAERVCVFIDYQNTFGQARRLFHTGRYGPTAGQFDPLALARLIVSRRCRPSVLQQVCVYRAAGRRIHPKRKESTSRSESTSSAVRSEGLHDVGIMFSTDTDLVPALEAALEIETTGVHIEVAAWKAKGSNRRSSVGRDLPWCHQIDDAGYQSVRDTRDYNQP